MTQKIPQTIYIALGSNLGQRLGFLQQGLEQIDSQIGPIIQISRIYETQAVGFTAPAFLNGCLQARSTQTPQQIMQALLKIEANLGRTRDKAKLLQSRTLDLDLLFVEQQVLSSAFLQLPHPKISERRFVLQPLSDIASGFIHPIFGQTISQLLAKCQDKNLVKLFKSQLVRPKSFTN